MLYYVFFNRASSLPDLDASKIEQCVVGPNHLAFLMRVSKNVSHYFSNNIVSVKIFFLYVKRFFILKFSTFQFLLRMDVFVGLPFI